MIVKPVNKRSEGYEQHQKTLEALSSTYFSSAKDAVIEKFLTFCKNHYIDEMMQWRKKLIAIRLSSREQTMFKGRLHSKRFCEQTGVALSKWTEDDKDP